MVLKKLVERITESISSADSGAHGGDREKGLQLATAVLMVEVARADHHLDETEIEKLLDLMASHFDLGEEAASELADEAHETATQAVDVHAFTQLLHENLGEPDKARIVDLLWQLAYADGQLDKYEDSLVLKIADLLHVSRGRVMRLKHDAAAAAQG